MKNLICQDDDRVGEGKPGQALARDQRRRRLPPIVKRLNAEVNRAMQQPDVNAKLVTAGLLVANESADYFQKFIRSEYAKYGKLVRSIGLANKL